MLDFSTHSIFSSFTVTTPNSILSDLDIVMSDLTGTRRSIAFLGILIAITERSCSRSVPRVAEVQFGPVL